MICCWFFFFFKVKQKNPFFPALPPNAHGTTPTLPDRAAWNPTLWFKAGGRRSSQPCPQPPGSRGLQSNTQTGTRYISLLCNNTFPCSLADPRRGRGALRLLVEAQPSPSRRFQPGGRASPHRERAGAVTQGAGRRVFSISVRKPLLIRRDSPAGAAGFLLDGESGGVGGRGAMIGAFLRLRKLLFKKAFLPFFN